MGGAPHGAAGLPVSPVTSARSGRTVLAIDWFSHGMSRRLEHGEWVHRSILDVQTEIGVGVDQSPGRPVLVGHSMGALASLAYAVGHRDVVAGLAQGIGATLGTLDGVGHGVAFDPGRPALCERIDGWLSVVLAAEHHAEPPPR